MLAEWLEMRLSADFIARPAADGQIHSQFASAVNLVFPLADGPERLITVLPPLFTGLPDSLVVSEAAFSFLAAAPAATPVRKEGLVIRLPDWGLILDGRRAARQASTIELAPDVVAGLANPCTLTADMQRFADHLAAFRATGAPADGFSLADPAVGARIRAALDRVIRGWLTGDRPGAQAALAGCLGWGRGLTPSADDALVGALALLEGARLTGGWTWPEPGARAKQDPLGLEAATRGRTTDISRKYLICAQEGRFADVLRNLVRAIWLGSPAAWPPLFAAAAGVGSTSGADMLAGLAMASQILLEIHSSPQRPDGQEI